MDKLGSTKGFNELVQQEGQVHTFSDLNLK